MARNLQNAVLIAPADNFIALTIARSLGRRGVRVVCLGSSNGLAQHSRFCSESRPLPSDKDLLASTVLDLTLSQHISHIMATTDASMQRLNQHRETLSQHAILLFPEAQKCELALHKDKTLGIAANLNIPIPKTLIIRNLSDVANAEGLEFPVVLKPRHQDVSKPASDGLPFKIRYSATYEDLITQLEPFRQTGDYPLIQEYCGGHGVGVEVLMHAGQPILMFQHERVREFPVSGGVSTCCKSVALDSQLQDWSVGLLRAMEWEGVAMVEFRKDNQTGRVVLMEVNGRFWGSLPLAVQAGCDFPYELYRTSLPGYCWAEPTTYTVGRQSRLLVAETKWLMQSIRGPRWRQAILEYFAAFRPSMKYYVWRWDDPLPAIWAFLNRIRRSFGKISQRLLGRHGRLGDVLTG